MPPLTLAVVATCLVASLPLWFRLVSYVRRAVLTRRAAVALAGGNPRRSRALARIASRGAPERARAALRVRQAKALLWEGRFERAIELLHSRLARTASASDVGIEATMIELQALLLDERADEARALQLVVGSAIRPKLAELERRLFER